MYDNERALKVIYHNLCKGNKYVEYRMSYRWPIEWTVLVADGLKPYFHYSHAGSSACKATLKDLKWTLDNIFKMSACDFIAKYECWPWNKYDKDLLVCFKDGSIEELYQNADYSSYFIHYGIDNEETRAEKVDFIADLETGEILWNS